MEETEDDDGWTATAFAAGDEPSSSSGPSAPSAQPTAGPTPTTNDSEEIIDIDFEDQDMDDDEDVNAFNPDSNHSNVTSPTRTYNLYISYSTSYRVPKFYLSGFNAQGSPLTPEEMFEDIMADYRNKTATIEKAPFEDDLTIVSIHPCRHASVMKTFLSRADNRVPKTSDEPSAPTEEDEWDEIKVSEGQNAIRVDQYLIVFLKFIASVTPGIEHDNTMSVL